jgi:hypothetical protein
MTDGWKPVVIEAGLYEVIKAYYEENQEELKLREGIRSLTAFINCCLREYLKKIGAI